MEMKILMNKNVSTTDQNIWLLYKVHRNNPVYLASYPDQSINESHPEPGSSLAAAAADISRSALYQQNTSQMTRYVREYFVF